jgi:hypothetical protein
MFLSAGFRGLTVEPAVSDSSAERADLAVANYPFGNGQVGTLMIDFGSVSTARSTRSMLAANIPGVCALGVEQTKHAHYDPLIVGRSPLTRFAVVAFELDGRWGDEAIALFRDVSRCVADNQGERNTWRAYWTRRLSVVLRCACASALNSRYKKAVAAAAPLHPVHNSPFTDIYSHLLPVPPLGAANPTFDMFGHSNSAPHSLI